MTKRMRGGEVKSVSLADAGHRPSTSHQQIHVLAVDDSVVDRKLIEMLLKTSSYKVTTVDSAVSALEILGIDVDGQSPAAASKFNMIITDYCMPKMTGYELLKKVKGTSFLREIPVVIMSSENVETRINSCYKEGAEDFIIKPVKADDVKRLSDHFRPKTGNPTPSATPRKRKRCDSTSNLTTDLIKCS